MNREEIYEGYFVLSTLITDGIQKPNDFKNIDSKNLRGF
jgi:hypothetical protein